MKRIAGIVIALTVVLFSSDFARAELVKIDWKSKQPYAEGKAMGNIGPYEQWTGVAHFAIDPKASANQTIIDLAGAPTNAQGKVEFRADVEVWLPADLSKASGTLFYEVNNRGKKTAPNMFHGGADEFLLRQGYIVVWSGWIAEVLPLAGKLLFEAPVALQDGKPIRGIVRNEFVIDRPATRASITHRDMLGAYKPAADAEQKAKLTHREKEADERIEIPRDQWEFAQSPITHEGRTGQLPLVEVVVPAGLKPGYIYEVVYEAEGALVQGTGMAGIRDLVSWFKHGTSGFATLKRPNGQPAVSHTLSFGTSQSGRLIRQFLYDGFNADEQGRRVFDGCMSHVAGGGLGFFNHRFASPTRTNGQHEEHLFPADYFPFAYGPETDPFTNQKDSILAKAEKANVAPKVMHTQSSSEYWHRAGSLVHTDPTGTKDSLIPENVRIYSFGGTQHGPGTGIPTPRSSGNYPSNAADYRPLLRALIVALDGWVRDGREPPKSAYPKLINGSLVDWHAPVTPVKLGWQPLPGVKYPTVIHLAPFVDRGPQWLTQRIATIEPPVVKGRYGVKVPGVTAPDNNERGTLNLPAIRVPIATYTSWNTRHKSIGAEGELLGLQGSYLAFPRTKADRERTSDPRPAVLERYKDFAEYQAIYLLTAREMIADRYLLEEDLPRLKALTEKQRPLFEQGE